MSTPNLQLPEVPEAILESSDEINDAHEIIDALLQLSVISRTVLGPPSTAQQGDRYIIPADAFPPWANRTNHLAYLSPSGWRYLVPRPGWKAWVRSEEVDYIFENSAWAEVEAGGTDLEDATVITADDETSLLPNSRQLIEGDGINIDASVPGEITINALQYLQPVANGDLDNPEVVFFEGDIVFVATDLA